ncbi:MAG: hypothetical protein LBG95_01730 [Treponema sp.]|jgi:hypothetical protein|nr:hypothetical protein [Treponema sp.]
MKKTVLVLFVGLLLSTAAFADHSGRFGLGGIFGSAYGSHGPDFYPGLSLKAGSRPLFWGFYGHILPVYGVFAAGVTGDYYVFDDWNLVDKIATNEKGDYHVKIDWYLGIGFFSNVHFQSDHLAFDIGGRIPFGVSWHAMETLEVTVGTAPGFGVYANSDKAYFHYVIPVEVSCRHWFK